MIAREETKSSQRASVFIRTYHAHAADASKARAADAQRREAERTNRRSKLRWVNVPVPPQHLVGLLLGAYLHFRLSQRLFSMPWMGGLLGLPLIAVGIWISIRASMEAGEMSIESPAKLLTTGPYARSRNPMYVGWTLLHLGISVAANSVWMISLLPAAIVFTHFVDVRREERILKAAFGDQYRAYQERVRRYF